MPPSREPNRNLRIDQLQGGTEPFVAHMRSFAKFPIKVKEEAFLFNPGLFERLEGGTGFRKKDNFKLSSLLVLDFDGATDRPPSSSTFSVTRPSMRGGTASSSVIRFHVPQPSRTSSGS